MKNYTKTALVTTIGAKVAQDIGGPASTNVAQGFRNFSAGFPAIGSALGGIEVIKATKKLGKFVPKY